MNVTLVKELYYIFSEISILGYWLLFIDAEYIMRASNLISGDAQARLSFDCSRFDILQSIFSASLYYLTFRLLQRL